MIPIFGIILYNKIFWITVALIALVLGYLKFQMIVVTDKISFNKNKQTVPHSTDRSHKILPMVMPVYYIRAQFVQLLLNAWFHSKSIMKLTSFWALIICCYIIILVNSVSLGTVHGVNSYPATYLMMEELQELTYYFFMTVVVFYSGEIMWKEREVKLNPICDTTPLNSFVNVSSRYLGLLILYAIIMFSLIIAGVLFQTFNSFYNYELKVYFFGFFVEIFPYLALYTSVTMFFQALIRNKFLAILATISFVVINVVISTFGLEHVLLNFGGHSLAGYSDMNGYGHFLTAYLLVKMYWFLFSMLLLILTGILMENGVEAGWKKRLKRGINQISKPMAIFCMTGLSLFCLLYTSDEEIHQHYGELLKSAETVIYGRITYQLMEFWRTLVENPSGIKDMDEFAAIMDRTPKIVFSRTLKNDDQTGIGWDSARLANKDFKKEISDLKLHSGKNIFIGSPSLIIQATNLGLIDEFQICIHPVIAGRGLPLFKNISEKTHLTLIKTKSFVGGAVLCYYKPAEK